VWPAADLAQARSLRSGDRSPLAQVVDSRLGEMRQRPWEVFRTLA